MTKSNSNAPVKASNPEDAWVKSKSPEIVQGMFTDIAGTYDFLNHLLSANIDKRWRKTLAKRTIKAGTARVLDVCGGTGDLSLALAREAGSEKLKPQIICSDFTPAMTRIAGKKFQNQGNDGALVPLVADTTSLPFTDNTFDLVTVAFGIRNVVDPLAGLKEMARVCRPGGEIAVLEFSKTRNAFINWAFSFYFAYILPFIGRVVTGTRAYSYLSKSVETFPEGQEFCAMMSEATGSPTEAKKLSFGIATLYISAKSDT